MACGLFAILMFILFYVYAKKYYNEKHTIEEEVDNTVDIEAVDISVKGIVVTFDANNKKLVNGESVRIMYNYEPCNGIVVRGNYQLHLEIGHNLPTRLVLIPKEDIEAEYVGVIGEEQKPSFNDEMDFVPKKKI